MEGALRSKEISKEISKTKPVLFAFYISFSYFDSSLGYVSFVCSFSRLPLNVAYGAVEKRRSEIRFALTVVAIPRGPCFG